MNTPEATLPVAILAGGMATRLRPLTLTIPKVMVEVAGKPFLEHQIEHLRAQGLRDIVMCVGFLGESIEERYGDGSQFGIRIRYSYDGPILLGTAGALRRALPMLGEEFFVLYGDSYLRVDFRAVATAFARSSRSALMTVFRNDNLWDKSNVLFSGDEIIAYDKSSPTTEMRHIDYGLSVCKSSVLLRYPVNAVIDLSDVMKDLAEQRDLAGYEATERFYEIGSHAGILELSRLLLSR